MGVVLYECSPACVRSAETTPAQFCIRILHDSPAPVSTPVAELPPRVDSIIERLLAKERAQRYDDAEQLIADLVPISRATRWSAQRNRGEGVGRAAPRVGLALIALGA